MSDTVYTGEDFDARVRKQVEFYFSDSNLQTDKFLWRIYEANDGWVELKTILTFGRMRQYRPEEKVISALKESDKLVLSANGDLIRRKDPLKDQNELKNTRKRNSVHVEGFPSDVSQESLEEWFNEKIVPQLPQEKMVCSIRRIRNRATKEFFGVVDVEFKTQEDAQHFLGLSVSYPEGVVDKDCVEEKNLLKKMSLLRFREMRESGKRFGVNDVTKRRNSFKDSNKRKAQKSDADQKDEKSDLNQKDEKDEKTEKESKPEEKESKPEEKPEEKESMPEEKPEEKESKPEEKEEKKE